MGPKKSGMREVVREVVIMSRKGNDAILGQEGVVYRWKPRVR